MSQVTIGDVIVLMDVITAEALKLRAEIAEGRRLLGVAEAACAWSAMAQVCHNLTSLCERMSTIEAESQGLRHLA